MRIEVRAEWDPEARVWVAESKDVPGLITEAHDTDTLSQKLSVLIPELLLENKCSLPERDGCLEVSIKYSGTDRLHLAAA
jgi:hypothetical protein